MQESDGTSQRRLHWPAVIGLAALAVGFSALRSGEWMPGGWTSYLVPMFAVLMLLTAYAPKSIGIGLLLVLGVQVLMGVTTYAIHGRADYVLYPALPFTLAGFVALAATGIFLRGEMTTTAPAKLAGAGFFGGTLFFLVSNFGVWAVGAWSDTPSYPMTAAGLLTCYEFGLPFYRQSLCSLTVWLPVLFSQPVLAMLTTTGRPQVAASPQLAEQHG